MIHQGETLKKIIRERKLSDEEFASMIGITRNGLLDIYGRERIKAARLTSILTTLKVDASMFADENGFVVAEQAHPYGNSGSSCEKLLEAKEEIIQELRQRIKDKEEIIALLKSQK